MILQELVGELVDDRYILQECVGRGATGDVYRAHQRVVEREVAVKLLRPGPASDENYRARFAREARALGRLDHPGCVRVYDSGWHADTNQPYLVTEYVKGRPLSADLHNLDFGTCMEIAAEVADALAHSHSRHIAHRDLKPDNILLTAEGGRRSKIVDFGLARVFDGHGVLITREGDAFGTPAYMSPEQCVGEDVVGVAADVYALGCILFEYVEGHLPFQAPTASKLMIKHVTRPTPRLTRVDLPAELPELIYAMLAKDPDARPTMPEVARVLTEVAKLGFVDDPQVRATRLAPNPHFTETVVNDGVFTRETLNSSVDGSPTKRLTPIERQTVRAEPGLPYQTRPGLTEDYIRTTERPGGGHAIAEQGDGVTTPRKDAVTPQTPPARLSRSAMVLAGVGAVALAALFTWSPFRFIEAPSAVPLSAAPAARTAAEVPIKGMEEKTGATPTEAGVKVEPEVAVERPAPTPQPAPRLAQTTPAQTSGKAPKRKQTSPRKAVDVDVDVEPAEQVETTSERPIETPTVEVERAPEPVEPVIHHPRTTPSLNY